jgi:signal transduction histidine kinase
VTTIRLRYFGAPMMEQQRASGAVFVGGGRAGAQIRAIDWSTTPLGHVQGWPAALTAQVRAMLHTHQPMCVFWGPDLINLYNDGFLPILGEKHPAAMGQRAEDCWREAWPIVGPQLRDVMQGRSLFHEEVLVPILRAGRVQDAWWNYSYSPLFDDGGEVAGVLVICTEITREVVAREELRRAQREAELARQELHGILMQAPLPMCILSGPEHRFTLANPPYAQLVGREVVGKTLREAFHHDEVGNYLPLMDHVYATGEPFVLREAPLRLLHASGHADERVIDVAYYPHRDASGVIAGILVVVHDVTAQLGARREVEALALQQAVLRQQAEAASRAKDDFLASVSHELRTPLTAILGWSRILSQAPDHARMQRGLAVIERNAHAQAKIIDDILDVARIISGKLRLAVAPVDMRAVIEAAVESVRPAAAAKGVGLQVETDEPVPLIADDDRLQQIVWNLLANAVKFTPVGGVVTVRARRRDQQVHLEVEDTGQGISAAFLPHVFDRFRQDDASTTKRHAGLGLGLAIVRHLVELHGGTVRARSDGEGKGARFDVVLPVRAVDLDHGPGDARADRMRRAREADGAGAPLRGTRVLVVDDQPDARELVATVLEDAGANVLQAASVSDAERVLATADVAAIVSDIGMPGEDGYTFLKRVRATPRTRSIPALALTAFARAEDRAHALACGFQGHVAKPIDPARLVATVGALLRR